jgi:hypothetical protein
MPGHVVLVDYPIGGNQGTSGACIWEASGHHKVRVGDKAIYVEETAHHGTIDETWLAQPKEDYELVVLRFKGRIERLEHKLPAKDNQCGAPVHYHFVDVAKPLNAVKPPSGKNMSEGKKQSGSSL